MFSKDMFELGKHSSAIRQVSEYARLREEQIGAKNIYDFSLGNPSIPTPTCVKERLLELIEKEDYIIHSYTPNRGDYGVRKAIVEFINKRHGTKLNSDNIYMTVGANASLGICCKALAELNNEFIAFAPFFTEYRVLVESCGGKLVVVPPNMKDFQINFEAFESLLTEHTKAVIVNSPNNPSGVVYSEETIIKLSKILSDKSEEYGHTIYLIADEPYREIVYNDLFVPYCVNYYPNTFVCYSYSKSLSLPGERIGYIIVSNEMEDSKQVYAAVCGAGRALGYVCAPSLFQHLVAKCIGITVDISIYEKNRNLLYEGLSKIGYHCIKPDGAFYLFVKAPEKDANKFCEKARKYELFLVPADEFGCPGYVRIAYCVETQKIIDSLQFFEKLFYECK